MTEMKSKRILSITAEPILNDKYLRNDIDTGTFVVNVINLFIYQTINLDFILFTLTVSVYTAEIVNKEKISEISIAVCKVYPDMSLSHLKRVKAPSSDCRNFRIFIAKADPSIHEAIQSFCNANNLVNIRSHELPSKPPLTRAQYTAAKEFWPTNFHENKQ